MITEAQHLALIERVQKMEARINNLSRKDQPAFKNELYLFAPGKPDQTNSSGGIETFSQSVSHPAHQPTRSETRNQAPYF
jgi:hypothetical protein